MQETMTVMLSTRSGAAPEPVEVPRRVGNVRLSEMLGAGSAGVVFSGFDEALGRRVAVKLLHRHGSDLTEQALTELIEGVRAAASVKHPNLVTVYSVERLEQGPVIVMEMIDGTSLRALLLRRGALDPALGSYVIRSLARGVEALHNADVVHRDLKPANVLLDREGGAHVCDFGLAVSRGAPVGDSAQRVAGSPLYMAPEMFDGQVSPQSDVYAIGVMLFEALAGQAPFSASTLSEMRAAHSVGDVPLHVLTARGVTQELTEIVRRSLHKQRMLRYKTAGHLLRALEAIAPRGGEDALQHRLAELVLAGPGVGEPAPARESTPPPAQTTFDLVARRAAERRAAPRQP
jgi:serine/threonine protein kinase